MVARAVAIRFAMPEANQKVLVSGTWDTTSVLLAEKDRIAATVGKIPYLNDFRG